MKKYIIKFLKKGFTPFFFLPIFNRNLSIGVFCVLLSYTCCAQAENIQSTASGGLWESVDTWKGGKVPSQTDDVEIFGNVQFSKNTIVNSLVVSTGSILSMYASSYTPEIFYLQSNSLKNNGDIGVSSPKGSENNFYLRIEGSIENNANINKNIVSVYASGNIKNGESSNWSGRLYLFGEEKRRRLDVTPGFTPTILLVQDIELQQDFDFSGSINLLGNTLFLNGEKDIHIGEINGYGKVISTINEGKNQSLHVGSLYSNSENKFIETNFENTHISSFVQSFQSKNDLYIKDKAIILGNIIARKVFIEGDGRVGGKVTINGNMVISSSGSLIKYPYEGIKEIYTLSVHGNVENYGNISKEIPNNEEHNYILNIYGNLKNFGNIFSLSYGMYIYGNVENQGSIFSNVVFLWEAFGDKEKYKITKNSIFLENLNYAGYRISQELLTEKNIVLKIQSGNEEIKRCINSTDCEEKKESFGVAIDSCPYVPQVENIQVQYVTKNFQDFFTITWNKKDSQKVKLVQTYPEYFVIPIEENSYTGAITDSYKQSYFLVSYNDCNPGIYSEQIQVFPKKSEQKDQPLISLSLKDTYISLQIEKSVNAESYRLLCTSGENIIIDKQEFIQETFRVSENFLKIPFSCSAGVYTSLGKYIQSPIFVYIPQNSQEQTLETVISLLGFQKTTLEKDFPLLMIQLNTGEKINYGNFANFIVNTIGNIFVYSKEDALNIMKNIGLIQSQHKKDELINVTDFQTIFKYVLENKRTLQEDIQKYAKNYSKMNSLDMKDFILQTLIYEKKLLTLKNVSLEKYEILKSCYIESCDDFTYFKDFMNEVLEEKKGEFTPQIDIEVSTLQDYSKILYTIYLYISQKSLDTLDKEFIEDLQDVTTKKDTRINTTDLYGLGRLQIQSSLTKKLLTLLSGYKSIVKQTTSRIERKEVFKNTYKNFLLFENEMN